MRFFLGVGFFGEGCSCVLMVNLEAATTTTVLLYSTRLQTWWIAEGRVGWKEKS